MTSFRALATTQMATSGQLMTLAAFAILFALFGYRISARFRLARGVTPWRLPSLVWALICLVLLPIGIIVELFAEFTTRPLTPGDAPPGASRPLFPPPTTRPVVAGEVATAPPQRGPAPPEDGSGKPALFGWYRDVTGRHEQRYWDGRQWSDHVADKSVVGTDPI